MDGSFDPQATPTLAISHCDATRYPPGKLRITIEDEWAEEEAEAEEELAKMTL